MQILDLIKRLTSRERVLTGISAGTVAALIGVLLARNLSWPSWEAIDASAGVIAAILTVLAVWIAWNGFWQNQAMQEKEYRAYVGIYFEGSVNEALTKPIAISDVRHLIFTLKNYGRTPALKLNTAINFEIGPLMDRQQTLSRQFPKQSV